MRHRVSKGGLGVALFTFGPLVAGPALFFAAVGSPSVA